MTEVLDSADSSSTSNSHLALSADGSLVLPHLFHTANNFTFFVVPVLPTGTGDSTRPLWIGIGLLWVVVAVVVLLTGSETLSRNASRVTYTDR